MTTRSRCGRNSCLRSRPFRLRPGTAPPCAANLFDPISRQLVLRRQIRNALAAVDVPRLRQLRGELDNLTVALTAFARGYGFRVCGEE